ncbi:phosphopantetheine-binding protein [Nocardia sp. NPDC004068]|uniref:phosphopantetheine-binding protein n=1 Tax=Nocardia sp. NPDC004068 TaxID=3364303 RepID=UPI0036B85D4D
MTEPSADEIRDTVHRIVRGLAPEPVPDPIGPLDLVDELGFHSLALLELAVALEDELGLPPMNEEGVQDIRTVDDVETFVRAAIRDSAV